MYQKSNVIFGLRNCVFHVHGYGNQLLRHGQKKMLEILLVIIKYL
jgi:hypothetical protein